MTTVLHIHEYTINSNVVCAREYKYYHHPNNITTATTILTILLPYYHPNTTTYSKVESRLYLSRVKLSPVVSHSERTMFSASSPPQTWISLARSPSSARVLADKYKVSIHM